MLRLKQGVVLVSIGAIGFLAGRFVPGDSEAAFAAQPEKKTHVQPDKRSPGAPDAAKLEEMMKAQRPGLEHKRLEQMVGTFKGGVKMWMEPDTEPIESKGTITREWILDGNFLQENVTGDPVGPDGPPFKGLGIIGYNTIEKKYETAWFENMATNMSTSTGTWDEATKTFTFTGEMLDPMSGQRSRTRTVVDLSKPGREVMHSYCTRPGVKEYKCFEGDFERVGK